MRVSRVFSTGYKKGKETILAKMPECNNFFSIIAKPVDEEDVAIVPRIFG